MYSGSNPISISHIKQMHSIGDTRFLSPVDYEKIAFSQYNVAEAILQNQKESKSIVLVEGLTQDLTPLEMSITKADDAQYIFPHGLPKTYSELDDQQKYFLVTVGGPYTLYYLHLLPNLYKTLTPEEDNEIRSKLEYDNPSKMLSKIYHADGSMTKEYDKLINKKRELSALKLAVQAAIETENPNILLVFGDAHDFKNRIKLLSNPAIVFKKNIDTHIAAEKQAFGSDIHFFKQHKISSQDIALLVSCIAYCLVNHPLHSETESLSSKVRLSL